MIVDGRLGHVSLENTPSSNMTNQPQQQPTNLSQQANIHQGSIPATGRLAAGDSSGAVKSAVAGLTPPTSAANSLQFNQLIGGAMSPSVVQGAGGNHMMIGDYVNTASNGAQNASFRQ